MAEDGGQRADMKIILFVGGQAFLIVVMGYISKGAVVRGQGAEFGGRRR